MKHIVTIGGGTGSYTVLSGLKNIPGISLTALVSMADDGGSTGVLRDELGVLPPGDVRQCLVALSEHSDIVRKLINYRFDDGTLKGYSFGNIFLAALEKVTGNFIDGVEVASEILKVKGRVIPVTSNQATLSILLSNGKVIEGEDKINHFDIQDSGVKKVFYKNDVKLNKRAREAMLKADYIILGPGNYYCSIIPNLIVDGFNRRWHRRCLYMPICLLSVMRVALRQQNYFMMKFSLDLTNKQEHTKNWKVSDYIKGIETYIGKKVDIILVNNEPPSKEQIEHYRLQEGAGVLVKDDLNDPRIIRESLLSHLFVTYSKADKLQNARSFIRHDGDKLADCVRKIIKE